MFAGGGGGEIETNAQNDDSTSVTLKRRWGGGVTWECPKLSVKVKKNRTGRMMEGMVGGEGGAKGSGQQKGTPSDEEIMGGNLEQGGGGEGGKKYSPWID